MHDESNKQPCCNPPWEPPQVIPAQVRRVNNLIFRKINQVNLQEMPAQATSFFWM